MVVGDLLELGVKKKGGKGSGNGSGRASAVKRMWRTISNVGF